MQQIQRDIQHKIEKWFFKGKILILYGARQVGKTTLSKHLLQMHGDQADYFDCEIIHVKQALQNHDPVELRKFLGGGRFIILDEAQKVPNIGTALKLLIDHYPDMQIIATGSSSFDLANSMSEPLTGRALEFSVYPLSLTEMKQVYRKEYELDGQLERFMRFGMYPEVVQADEKNAQVLLDNLSSKYLYKDIFELEEIQKPDLLTKLLQLLALQLGSEVSIHELATKLQHNKETIERYLHLLTQAFIIFPLRAFSRNMRNEIGKKEKYYFYDLGIRNSLIGRYGPFQTRDDIGALWENLCIIERMKRGQITNGYGNRYFWRTYDQKEIDYIEEYEGVLHGYEFKYAKKTFTKPKQFTEAYPNSTIDLINKDNYKDFLMYTTY